MSTRPVTKQEIITNIFKHRTYMIIFLFSLIAAILAPIVTHKYVMPTFQEQIMFNIIDDSKRVSNHLIEVYQMDHDFSHMQRMKEDLKIEKIKFFNHAGYILYSTDPKDIGSLNKHEYFFNVVAKGEVFYKIAQKGTKTLEGRMMPISVAEVYIPIMEQGKFVYAVEVYYDITDKIFNFEAFSTKINTLNLIVVSTLLLLVLIILYNESRSNLQLTRAKKIAEDATQAKSDFLANMSLEIRTPLNAILGFVSLLKEEHTDEEKIRYVNTINQSSNALLGIINDILDMSKIESGKLKIDRIDFFPLAEFESVRELFLAKAKEKNIDLRVAMSALPASLHSDPLRIKQVIFNLLSNAIKFTPKDGVIHLNIDYREGELFVSVRDNGIGIDAQAQERIFEAFSQAEDSTARKFGGTGLGLSISAALVEMLDGELELKSEEGKGSEFYFSIPIALGGAKSIAPKPINTERKFDAHILLVEDNKTNQMLMSILLRKLGITFDIAEDGYEAIESFQNRQYNLILMDVNMPRMGGIEATQRILEIEKENQLIHTPIIALTANALKGDKKRFLDAGMDEYISKPIDRKKLVGVLDKFILT
jgi:signal transduction histidine kinase/CheY-like chemotaxis protein